MAEIAGVLKIFTSVAGFLGGMGGSDAPADTMIEGVSARDDASLAALEDSGGWKPIVETGGNEVATNEYQSLVEEFQNDGTLTNGANVGEITGAGNLGEITTNGAGMDSGASFTDQPQSFTLARGAEMADPTAANGANPLDTRLGLDMERGYGAVDQAMSGANRSDFMAADTNPTAQSQAVIGAKPGQSMLENVAFNQPLPGDADPNVQNPLAGENFGKLSMSPMTSDMRDASLASVNPGNTFDPLADLQQPSGQNRIGLTSPTPPGQQVAQQGNGGGTGNRYQLQQRQMPASFQQQGKGGIDMGAALKAMAGLAASRKKEEEKRMIPGASARTWQQGYPGAPGMPGAVPPPGAPQGMLGQVAMGGQQVYSPRPTFQRPLVPRRPVTV